MDPRIQIRIRIHTKTSWVRNTGCRVGWRTWPPSCWRRRTRSPTSSALPTRADPSRTRSTSSARPATRSGWFLDYLFRIRILLVKYGIPDPDPTCLVFRIRILLFKYSGSGSYLSSIPNSNPTVLVKYSESGSYLSSIPDPVSSCKVFRIWFLLVKYSGSGSYLSSIPDPSLTCQVRYSGSRVCNLCNSVVDQERVWSILPPPTYFWI